MSNDNPDGPDTDLKLTLDQGIDLNIYKSSRGMMSANLLVNDAILQLQTSSNTTYFENTMAPIYQDRYTLDKIYSNLSSSLGTIVLLPLMLIYLRQTFFMLKEKETKVREAMSIMGMKIRNYYFSWFVRYYAVYVALHLICAAIISTTLTNVPFYIPFIVFILFDLVLVIQNFFIQVFLTRSKIGVVVSLLFFILQYILSFISTNSNNPTIEVNASISVIPHAAFILAFQTMIYA
jgi:ATP-binding cassette subfamily A (ABC1) protein 3